MPGVVAMVMPTLSIVASNKPYSTGTMALLPATLNSFGSDPSTYVAPPDISYAMGDMYEVPLVMSGYMLTGGVGNMDTALAPLSMIAADKPYAEARMSIPMLGMQSYTHLGNFAASIGSAVSPIAQIPVTADYSMLLASVVDAASTMLAGRAYLLSMVSKLNMATSMLVLSEYHLLLDSLLGVTDGVLISGVEYDCMVVNKNSGGISMYDNFKFNSFAKVGDNYFAAGQGGLYKLTGDTDAGASINSSVLTMKTAQGSKDMKNIPYAYMGIRTNGDIGLTVTTDSGNTQQYTLSPRDDAMRNTRVPMAKGVRAMYWQFELSSASGLDLDYIDTVVVSLNRKI
jgi:hypothetical protein